MPVRPCPPARTFGPRIRSVTALVAGLATALALALMGVVPPASAATSSRCPWVGSTAPIPDRVAQLVGRMNSDQKIAMLHGTTSSYVGMIAAQPGLCIPAVNFEDGPAGVGDHMTDVTQLPAPVAAAATWDTAAEVRYGQVLGSEQAAKGTDVTLAPTVNIVRDPRWGRAFESQGEDPYLAGLLGASVITGIQSTGQLAQVKHLAVYNQETSRNTPDDDARVSVRAMQEIYLPAFQAAVRDADVASVMCAYSSVNGEAACQNRYLETTVLRDQMGFAGFVTSDWNATKSTVDSANAGLDVQMPDASYYGAALKQAVQSGQVTGDTLDGMVGNILSELFAFGRFDSAPTGSPTATATNAANVAAARSLAAEGTVLLKNSGSVLPLANTGTVAVIGADASTAALYAGGGSASVVPSGQVSPLAGITARADKATVRYDDGSSTSSAASTAAGADVAIVFAGLAETEEKDLSGIDLLAHDNAVISAVAAANPHTVVVLNTGSAVTMPWLDKVAGVLEAWYPGQQNGAAIASVLYGDQNPSGHLPVTFPKSLSDVPASTAAQFPGTGGTVQYSEGLDVGYRWYQDKGITPLFPFGFGLSYTSFAFSDLTVSPVHGDGSATVTATVTNTGSRSGATVAQLYVGFPSAAAEPSAQLKGFRRVALDPGRSTTVTFDMTRRDLQFFDSATNSWATAAGNYSIAVGDSSAHTPLTGTLAVRSATPGQTVTITAPGSQDVTAGRAMTLSVAAKDSAGAPLTYTASGLPAGLTLSASGTITGTPTTPGTTTVAVHARDASGANSATTFTVTVNPADGAGGPVGTVTGLAGRCLDVNGDDSSDGTPVLAFLCNGTDAQQWTLHHDGTVRALGKCLDVVHAGKTDGAGVDLFSCNGTAAQLWTVSGSTLVNTGSGKCLDVPRASSDVRTQLDVFACNGTSAQKWHVPTT